MTETTKKRYRVLVGLDYPTDPDVLRRLRAGENLPVKERHMKRVEPGTVVDDLPGESVAGLLARGRIELVAEPAPARPTAASRTPRGGGEEVPE